MKKVYQLQLKGKDRAYHNFRTEDEALQHQERLIRLCKSKIASGQLSSQAYLREAQSLEVATIEILDTSRVYSIVEVVEGAQSIVKNYFDRETAITVCAKISENSTRNYNIMESFVNGK